MLLSPVPLGPVGLCCTLTQGAREPGGHTSQPFWVLLLRAGFASVKEYNQFQKRLRCVYLPTGRHSDSSH